MTFAELQADVRRKLNESSATFWTDQDIKDALNEAYEEMGDATEFYERQATLIMLAKRTYYDLTSLLPDTFLSPRRCWNTITQRWARPTDPLDQDLHTSVQWELTNGPPEAYFIRGNWWLGVWPRSASDADSSLRFYYTAIPARMSASTDVPGFPQEFHPGIVALALSDLLAQERETRKALGYWNTGQEYGHALRAHVEGRQRIAKMDVL